MPGPVIPTPIPEVHLEPKIENVNVPAPEINLEVNPDVKVTAQQPEVKVENIVNVPKMRSSKERQKVKRGKDKLITSSETDVEYIYEDE